MTLNFYNNFRYKMIWWIAAAGLSSLFLIADTQQMMSGKQKHKYKSATLFIFRDIIYLFVACLVVYVSFI